MASPHKSRLGTVVVDCRGDLKEAANFWSAAFGYEPEFYEVDTNYVGLKVPGDEVRVLLQQVDHAPRVHLDIETDDKEAEAERLTALGARPVARVKRWIVMEAPTGHRFCVVDPQRGAFEANAPSRKEAD